MTKKLIYKKSKLDSESEAIIKEGLNNHAKESIDDIVGSEYELLGIYNEENKLLGGAVFRNKWGALDVKYLYIQKELRGLKLGKQLLEKVCHIGKNELNCQVAYLSTYSYQSLGFYLKFGFNLEFTRNGYKNNILEHYLYKIL